MVVTPWPHPTPSCPFQLYSIHLPQAVRSLGQGRHPIPSSSIDQFCFCFILTSMPLCPSVVSWAPYIVCNDLSPSLSCVSVFSGRSQCRQSPPPQSIVIMCVVRFSLARLGDKSQSGCLLCLVNRLVTSAHYRSLFRTAIKIFFCSSFLGFWFIYHNKRKEDRKPDWPQPCREIGDWMFTAWSWKELFGSSN